ncbi:hypothetical protein L484_000378 [Morus notabilis]|uniref:Uncharacterized protein n=1 Tax=Morus notabilis TaxID=981085 RepID=W9SEP2_9ROSA|nr:hypothetical protein L484_000378 [Morus notabilis]
MSERGIKSGTKATALFSADCCSRESDNNGARPNPFAANGNQDNTSQSINHPLSSPFPPLQSSSSSSPLLCSSPSLLLSVRFFCARGRRHDQLPSSFLRPDGHGRP